MFKSLDDKFNKRGLVVIGVHSPEFNHERVLKNVYKYQREDGIRYVVAIDNDYKTWNSSQNHYWPATYLIDKQGVIRNIRIGEGGYDQTEKEIRELLWSIVCKSAHPGNHGIGSSKFEIYGGP